MKIYKYIIYTRRIYTRLQKTHPKKPQTPNNEMFFMYVIREQPKRNRLEQLRKE